MFNTTNYAPGASIGNKKDKDKSPYGGSTTNSAPGAEAPRMAGDKLRELKAKQERLQERQAAGEQVSDKRLSKINNMIGNQKDKLYGDGSGSIADSFNAAATGAGAQKGTARVSKADMKELRRRYGKESVVEYMDGLAGSDDIKTDGQGAQNLLARYKSELTNSTVNPDQPDPGNPANPPSTGTPAPVSQQPPDLVPMPGVGRPPYEPTPNEPRPTIDTGGNIQANETKQTINKEVNNGDITTGDINGDGNILGHRTYMDGDTQMTINLQGGADTGAISRAMLLAGHGKPSNGSATTAKFVDMHQDLNNLAQAKYTNRGANTSK